MCLCASQAVLECLLLQVAFIRLVGAHTHVTCTYTQCTHTLSHSIQFKFVHVPNTRKRIRTPQAAHTLDMLLLSPPHAHTTHTISQVRSFCSQATTRTSAASASSSATVHTTKHTHTTTKQQQQSPKQAIQFGKQLNALLESGQFKKVSVHTPSLFPLLLHSHFA